MTIRRTWRGRRLCRTRAHDRGRVAGHRERSRPRRHLVATTAVTLAVAYAAHGCSAGADLTGPRADGRATGVESTGRGGPLTPFDVGRPAIARLDAGLLRAVQAAARDAEDDGVAFVVTSGWRSRAHQERLFADAVTTYGSVQEARRRVATPDASAHVTGHAVDIGPTDADSWLSQHGARYGLCQTFANEMWHFELAATPGGVCPAMLPDGTSR